MDPALFFSYFAKKRQKIEEDFCKLLTFRTISADVTFHTEMRACAHWLSERLREMGAETELWGDHAPVVFGNIRSKKEKAPTLLIYAHYDVQPVDPLHEWKNPPFEPKIEEGVVFARGAADDKGACILALHAVQALLDVELPCHVKFLFDGEEESGSTVLFQELRRKKELLRADYVMVIDLGMKNRNTPAVTLGCRGIISMTMTVKGPSEDMHSGAVGGMVYNPLHATAKILAALHDEHGVVTVPGFYDAVRPLSESEREGLDFSFDEKAFEAWAGQPPLGGEASYSPLERNWVRPTLEVNGIHGGYGGPGGKTVIPREAIVKISCRLVPDQDPHAICKMVAAHLRTLAPKGCYVDVAIHEGKSGAVRVTPAGGVRALEKAMALVWKNTPCRILEGASIPIMSLLGRETGGELIPWGPGLDSDLVHAPNEHFDMERLEKGMVTLALAIAFLGER